MEDKKKSSNNKIRHQNTTDGTEVWETEEMVNF
jgi:hypothetical protein